MLAVLSLLLIKEHIKSNTVHFESTTKKKKSHYRIPKETSRMLHAVRNMSPHLIAMQLYITISDVLSTLHL